METFNHRVNSYLESWLGPRDPRVRGMLLLDHYTPTFALTVLYLAVVWLGPKYMQGRPPCSCRGLMLLYNLGLTLLSLYMFCELVAAAWSGSYSLVCQDLHGEPEADLKVVKVLWWYFFSKVVEFMDTLFFILRKNNHQITFLHIYHHASMLNIWWFVMNWIPCGHSFFGASINSLVHVVMYSYYGLSAIPAVRPYIWWKRYITQLQLTQFFLSVVHTSCALLFPCGFSQRWLFFQISYMLTLIVLFTNFYIQTYRTKRIQIGSEQKQHHNGRSSTNGLTRPGSADQKQRMD